jgi:hypothetical protein
MLAGCSLLAQLVAQSQSGPDGSARWAAEVAASGAIRHFTQGDSYSGWHGGGEAAATWFVGRPLVDDATPLTLQSYLQRLSRLSLGFGGSGFSGKDTATAYEHSGSTLFTSLGGHLYRGWLVLGAELYYTHLDDREAEATEERHDTSLWYPELRLGFRHQTLELLGSYRYKSYYDDGVLRPRQWGQAGLLLQAFVEELGYWRVEANTLVDGFGLAFNLETFTDRTTGVWASGYFERGQIYTNSTASYDRKGASVGVGYWPSSSVELQLGLGFSTASRESDARPLNTITATAGVVVRVPKHDRDTVEPSPEPTLPGYGPTPAASAPAPSSAPPVELPGRDQTPSAAPPPPAATEPAPSEPVDESPGD